MAFTRIKLDGDTTPIADGGTGQITQQAAIDALTAVSGATDEHILTKDTGTGNAIFKAAAGGGAAQDVNLLDGAEHNDTVAQGVTRGSLIYGDSTPNWNELVVGAANSVLWTDGTDVSWSAAPRLANIADTGGTNRIKIGTSSPHVEIDDTLRVEKLGIASAPTATNQGLINITPSLTTSAAWQALKISPNITLEAGQNVLVLQGLATVKDLTGLTGIVAKGLQFEIAAWGQGAITSVFAKAYAVDAIMQPVAISNVDLTITDGAALQGQIKITEAAGGQAVITAAHGLHILSPSIGTGVITTYYGAAIEDSTSGTITNNYLLEVGGTIGTTPYLRVAGNFTAATNETPIYISEGATPTLRQLQTKAGNTLGSGDLAVVLV